MTDDGGPVRLPQQRRPGATWWLPERPCEELVGRGVVGCQGCELHGGGGPVAPTDRAGPARVVVVASSPRGERPFADPLWAVVDEALERAGLALAAYRTHLVKHPHPQPCRDRGRRPGACAHEVACFPWLWAELEMVRPEGILLLGPAVSRAVRALLPPAREGDAPWTWTTPAPPADETGRRRDAWTGLVAATIGAAGVTR